MMDAREVKRPGRPEQVVKVLSIAEARQREAELRAESWPVKQMIGQARAKFVAMARQRSSAIDDAE